MGLIGAVVTILCIRRGALVHLATVCTSFNFMNSGTHQRSIAFPLGWRQDLSYVDLGNILASRSAVLALLAWAFGGFPVLEQPLRSIMTALPSWQSVVSFFDEAECRGWTGQRLKLNKINMAAFRTPTLKPTALYSTEAFDVLMNMRVPPKSERPASKDPVTFEYLGFIKVREGHRFGSLGPRRGLKKRLSEARARGDPKPKKRWPPGILYLVSTMLWLCN